VQSAGTARLDAYLSVFLTDAGGPRKQLLTAGLAKSEPDLARSFNDEGVRVGVLCEKRRAAIARDRTMALLTLASEVLGRYAAEKTRRSLLDYDDLISHTRHMLDRVDSSWVHYKLDLGIDHLLIDEAQDTSPAQWDIIKKFVSEFTAGAGARGGLWRSIFAVGDDKQSIFSFQDAAPEAFAEMRQFFKLAHDAAGLPFQPIPFQYSFRSAPTVLEAVDEVFKQPGAHAGLTVVPGPTAHSAVRAAAPGLVELWPMVEPDERGEVDPWDAPFDTTSETSPRVKLARQIAAAIKTWIGRGDLVGDGDNRHPVRAGDILVLVRQRGALFEAIIRAIKTAGIPVAGADRLVLTEHIAVMDLLVLADAISLPTDDLAVATILKSPIFGVDEQELFDLAHDREGSLIVALRTKQPDIAKRFYELADLARESSPFAFYAELLGAGGGRKAFLSRLGLEANDALDEFLNLALEYERRETPSLQGFAAWLRTASAEVKRDMELARNEVRVMTVHGAKGLEAPIVVLADTTTEPAGPVQYQPRLLSLPPQNAPPGTLPLSVWVPTKKEDTEATATARSATARAAEDEYRRLLYVAMTRAADRLIVCGSVGERRAPTGCWYELIQQGLAASNQLVEEPADHGDGKVLRFRKGPPDAATEQTKTAAASQLTLDMPPSWLTTSVAPDPVRAEPIRPSGFVDDPPLAEPYRAGQARQRALARGNIVHRLMQSLPEVPLERRAEMARRFIARQKAEFSEAEQSEIARQVLGLLTDTRFAELFAPGSRAEVPIVGRVNGRTVNGVVDRLVVTQDAVLIADYKTNRPAPANVDNIANRYRGYVRQLALYREVLKKIYPGRAVRAALVWTDTPSLMEIPTEKLHAALEDLTSP
jgi:ATP-dependent helicase/nuclease subunit A